MKLKCWQFETDGTQKLVDFEMDIKKALSCKSLTQKQRDVLLKREEGKTYKQIGIEIGVSDSRVSQILAVVFSKLEQEDLLDIYAQDAKKDL